MTSDTPSMPELALVSHGDDPQFIGLLNAFFLKAILSCEPSEVFLVRVDNWFDHKWLGFAGKQKVPSSSGLDDPDFESAVVPVWKTRAEITVPPFSRNRIVDEVRLSCRLGIVSYRQPSSVLHPNERLKSPLNLRRRVLDCSSRGLFFWFSSQSGSTGRASLMLYRTDGTKVGGWYASFARHDQWNVHLAKNMDRAYLVRMFTHCAQPPIPEGVGDAP